MRVAMVALAVVLAGCASPTASTDFEQRFDAGTAVVHVQTSPTWRDPGLYDSLPTEGEHKGFEITVGTAPEMVVMPAGTPTRFEFQDDEIDAAWGSYELDIVRWADIDDPDPTRNLVMHLDPESIQGHFGLNVDDAQLRMMFRIFTEAVTGVTGEELDEMEEDFMAERHRLEASPPGNGMRSFIDGYYSTLMYQGDLRLHDHFEDLGGFSAFSPVARHVIFLLPTPGQIDLVQGNWQFAFETPSLMATRGPFHDTEAFLVTPDDSVQYLHWGEEDYTDQEVARELEAAIKALGRDAPDTSGWAFARETVEGGPGD